MASRIQPKDATLATTGVACLVAAVAWILINSIYVGSTEGWPQFALSVFAAVTVVGTGLATLAYAAHQQLVLKNSLFVDHDHSGSEFDYRTTGQWAVVTGATDGIGKEYARQLAADYGMDVLLVGRNPDKLRAVATLIRKESNGRQRRVMTVVADFAEDPVARRGQRCGGLAADAGRQEDGDHRRGIDGAGQQGDDDHRGWDPEQLLDDVGDRCFCGDHRGGKPSGAVHPVGRGRCTRWYPRLRAVIERCLQATGGVGVLINCAGVSYPHPEYFAGMRGERGGGAAFNADFCDSADAAVRCNVAAAVHACRLVLPGMLARGRGLIVNVGSASASVPPAAPLMTLYAATKKFLEKLSADLDAECTYLNRKSSNENCSTLGVRVQCARPAYVATAMLRSANPDVRVISDADCSSDGEDDCADDDDDYGDRCWWSARRQQLEDSVQSWLVPSARQWVRSALRQGGRLYGDSRADGPASFTGYWPHTLLVWCATVANAVTPRRWFVDSVLMTGMLAYRAKGRAAAAAAEKDNALEGKRSVPGDGCAERYTEAAEGNESTVTS